MEAEDSLATTSREPLSHNWTRWAAGRAPLKTRATWYQTPVLRSGPLNRSLLLSTSICMRWEPGSNRMEYALAEPPPSDFAARAMRKAGQASMRNQHARVKAAVLS